MGDDSTLSGTPVPRQEQTTDANPQPSQEPPKKAVEKEPPSPVPEDIDSTPVGVELAPTGDEDGDPPVLSEFFRAGVLKTMQNTIFAVEELSDMHRRKRISRGLRNHLEREAIRFGASQIFKMTENEKESR